MQGASDETIEKEILAPQPDDPQPLTEEEQQGESFCALFCAMIM